MGTSLQLKNPSIGTANLVEESIRYGCIREMSKECRNCGEKLTYKEKLYGWGNTCFPCIEETASEEELYYLQ